MDYLSVYPAVIRAGSAQRRIPVSPAGSGSSALEAKERNRLKQIAEAVATDKLSQRPADRAAYRPYHMRQKFKKAAGEAL